MPEYETPEPISVVLELRVAEVRVAAGDREDTVVDVRPSDGSKRDDVNAAEQTRVQYADGRLLVNSPRRLREWSPFSDGGSIDVQIGLPAGSELIGRAAVGVFRCTGTLGRCELRSSAGEIRLGLLWLSLLAGRLPRASLAAGTGVETADEVVKYLLAGADVVMTASALLRHGPEHLRSLVSDLEAWLSAHDFASVTAIKGLLRPSHPDAEAQRRGDYIGSLLGYRGPYVNR